MNWDFWFEVLICLWPSMSVNTHWVVTPKVFSTFFSSSSYIEDILNGTIFKCKVSDWRLLIIDVRVKDVVVMLLRVFFYSLNTIKSIFPPSPKSKNIPCEGLFKSYAFHWSSYLLKYKLPWFIRIATLRYPFISIIVNISGRPSALRSLNRGIEAYERVYGDEMDSEGREVRLKCWYGKRPFGDYWQTY